MLYSTDDTERNDIKKGKETKQKHKTYLEQEILDRETTN